MTLRVLCIDDDQRLHALLADYLGQNGVTLVAAPDGPRGLAALAGGGFDAVFLDVMMPGMDGLEVMRRIREKSTLPVIMLTAKGDETDRVVGLELGADDYLPKPFSARELLARLRAVLRRGAAEATDRITVGELSVEIPAHEARVRGEPVVLTGLAATSWSATGPSTCTSRTCARSSATTRARPASSRPCAASVICW
jgi:two-component system OmpR family response regulator